MDQPQVLGTIPRSPRRSTKERREEPNQGTKLPGAGGLSDQEGRTVRTGHTDSPDSRAAYSPLKPTEPPETNREKRTVREDQADRPRGLQTVRY
jgi:hypothetical protein